MAAPGLSRKACSPLGPLCEGAPPAGGGGRTVRLPEIFRAMARLSPSAPSGHLPHRGRFFDMQKGCRECGIPFCVLKECIVGAGIARPCPFVLQDNCPGKCVAAPSRRAANGRPYTCNRQECDYPPQECGAQFSVTVMVPILVLSVVVLPNAPLRESAAVPLGASSTAVPTAVRRSSCALSKLPLMPSKPEAAA